MMDYEYLFFGKVKGVVLLVEKDGIAKYFATDDVYVTSVTEDISIIGYSKIHADVQCLHLREIRLEDIQNMGGIMLIEDKNG